MTPDTYLQIGIVPALTILPRRFDSREARAMMLAIAWQETKLQDRRQMRNGPARGYPQFELGIDEHGEVTGGLAAMLKHPACAPAAAAFIHELDYSGLSPRELLDVMEWDTVLMAGMTRLNLFWNAAPLPKQDQRAEAWSYYLSCWRPGKPRPDDWAESWAIGWQAMD